MLLFTLAFTTFAHTLAEGYIYKGINILAPDVCRINDSDMACVLTKFPNVRPKTITIPIKRYIVLRITISFFKHGKRTDYLSG
jgi:hypothetical protein